MGYDCSRNLMLKIEKQKHYQTCLDGAGIFKTSDCGVMFHGAELVVHYGKKCKLDGINSYIFVVGINSSKGFEGFMKLLIEKF